MAEAGTGRGPGLQANRVGMLLCLVLLVGACATRNSHVAQRMILPEGVERYGLAGHQAFAYPVLADGALPAFPEDAPLRELPPTTVCVSLVVDAQGGVGQVAALQQDGCAPPAGVPALAAAAAQAVRGWRFEPALMCTYPDAATRDRDWTGHGCPGAVAEATPVAVTLGWAFTFEVRNGRGGVAMERLGER